MNANTLHRIADNLDIVCSKMQRQNQRMHPFRHRDMTRRDSIAKVILAKNDTTACSVFRNDESFTECVSNALIVNTQKICDWLNDAPDGADRDFVATDPESVPMQKSYVHRKGTHVGVTELNCKETTIRLIKDKTSDFGFYIMSAWPESEHGIPTNRDLTREIQAIPFEEIGSEQLRQQAIEESKLPSNALDQDRTSTKSQKRIRFEKRLADLSQDLERPYDDRPSFQP